MAIFLAKAEVVEYFRPRTVKTLRTLAENKVWLFDNLKTLKQQYPDQYVAVHRGKVVAHNKDVNSLKQTLRKEFREINHIAISFISSKKIQLILSFH